MPLIIFLTGFLSGVALRSIVIIPSIILSALFCASLVSLLFLYFVSRNNVLSKKVLYGVILILAISIGSIIYTINEFVFIQHTSEIENNKKIQITGIIDEIPIEGEGTLSAKIKGPYGYVIARFKKGEAIRYGDHVSIQTNCEIPESFVTGTGTMFDYKSHLMARNIHHVCKVYSFEIIEHDAGGVIQGRLYKLRLWFSDHIDKAFSNPHAGLVRGVLLGDKSGLEKDLKSDMTIAGVIHIAVLSGSNIAMLAVIIFGFMKSFPYSIRVIGSVTTVILFVLLSGAEPPAVRAGIFVTITFLGKLLHRKPHTGRALLIIAVGMIIFQPFALVYDMSFQLSFLATIGIVYVAPIVERYTQWITECCGLREVISGTVGAQVTVTPLLLHATGVFSFVSLPANVLIGWAVPVLMMFGFFGGLLHIIFAFLALPIVFLGEIISRYIIFVTQLAAHAPFLF